jgi:hypothetical protein
MRLVIAVLLGLCTLVLARGASAERIAVVALASANGPAPVVQADALSSHLLRKKHRTINSGDVVARVQAGNQGADAAWAAGLSQSVAQATAALTRLERRGASVLARQLDASIRRAGGGAGGAEPLVEWALLERALALSSAGTAGAARWTRTAAALGPNVVLDPLRYPEEVRNSFAAAVAAAEKSQRATLSVASTPSGAELWIDGVRRCATPCSTELPPGHHFARVVSPAHAPSVFEVELAPGAVLAREVGLSAAYSGASLEAIAAMLADPSRTAEAGSALLSVARFLDVDRVVALLAEPGGKLRLLVVPPSSMLSRSGLDEASLLPALDGVLDAGVPADAGERPTGTLIIGGR